MGGTRILTRFSGSQRLGGVLGCCEGRGDCEGFRSTVRGFPALQYLLSGHWEQYPESPHSYVPRSDGQLCHRWQPERCASLIDGKHSTTTKKNARVRDIKASGHPNL